MTFSILKQFEQVLLNRKANIKVKLVIFSFFLIVATTLWYLNKLSYEYTTDISFPLKVTNMPKGKVFVGEPPKTITLGVKAFGYTLLRYKIASSLSPVSLNLSQVPLIPVPNSETKFYVLTSRARRSIINQLKGELFLERIGPDTLFFEFTQLREKKVKVTPQIAYTFDRQSMLSGLIVVEPDSIIISGPSTIIDTIYSISSNRVVFDKIDSPISRNIELEEIKQVGYSHRKINLIIPVEKYTEARFTKAVEIRNLPDTLRLILLPRMVDVKCNVVISSYKNVSEIVDVFVDYNDVRSTLDNKLRVQHSSQPYLINNLSLEPMFVEYIIERF